MRTENQTGNRLRAKTSGTEALPSQNFWLQERANASLIAWRVREAQVLLNRFKWTCTAQGECGSSSCGPGCFNSDHITTLFNAHPKVHHTVESSRKHTEK